MPSNYANSLCLSQSPVKFLIFSPIKGPGFEVDYINGISVKLNKTCYKATENNGPFTSTKP